MAFICDHHDGIFWKEPASKLPLSLSEISVEGENYCKVVIYRDKLPHEYGHVVEVPSYDYHFDPGGTCFFYDKLKLPNRAALHVNEVQRQLGVAPIHYDKNTVPGDKLALKPGGLNNHDVGKAMEFLYGKDNLPSDRTGTSPRMNQYQLAQHGQFDPSAPHSSTSRTSTPRKGWRKRMVIRDKPAQGLGGQSKQQSPASQNLSTVI